MNKVTLVAMLIFAANALAEDGLSLTLEPEHERMQAATGHFWSDSLAAVLSYRAGANEYDFKVEGDKDHDAAAAASGKVEIRYRRYFDKLAGLEPSVRVSWGEVTGVNPDFSFYTFQPKISYEIGSWEPYCSIRYRNAFDDKNHYYTRTFYLGAAYAVNRNWEVEPSVFRKNGVETSNGVKLEITRGF